MKRLVLIAILMLCNAAFAQQPAPNPVPPSTVETAANSDETRNALSNIVRRDEGLGQILGLDPMLIANDQFLSGYPDLASFVASHPEVRRNPHFYLSEFRGYSRHANTTDNIIESVSVLTGISIAVFTFIWLVRNAIEQRRWSRMMQVQTEAHNKILDRVGSSSELLEYMRSPAGTKYLESAPIPLYANQPLQNPPVSRMLWSIQVGLVAAAGAIGMLLVSTRMTDKDTSQGLFAIGTIALCIGGGFILSALVSMVVSRRMGLWRPAADVQ